MKTKECFKGLENLEKESRLLAGVETLLDFTLNYQKDNFAPAAWAIYLSQVQNDLIKIVDSYKNVSVEPVSSPSKPSENLVKELCYKVLENDMCSRCDGVGVHNGCMDFDCMIYKADKILDELGEE